MKVASRARKATLLAEIEAAIAEIQPGLQLVDHQPIVVIEGWFELSGPEGPFDRYHVRILVPDRYPEAAPIVFELDERIPRTKDRHVNTSGGDCCLTVWEPWLVTAPDTSFRGFLGGPMHEFFLSQHLFDITGEWRFGGRPHGVPGIVEACAELLDIPVDHDAVFAYLKSLSKMRLKGHWLCPCGSGQRIRNCHHDKIKNLRRMIPPATARRMLQRLRGRISALH